MSTLPHRSHALVQAARKLETDWQRLRTQLGPLAAGCSCGAPVVSISCAAVERDLIAHLKRKYADDATSAAARVLAAADEEQALAAIIGRLAQELAVSAQAQPLLADLQRSIGSFDQGSLHCT